MEERLVREITDQDVDAVIALWAECGLTRPWNDPARDISFARAGANAAVLVAEMDGAVAAGVMVGHDGHRGWVYYLAASPALRGRGFGRLMLDAAENWLRRRGVWKLQLLVREENAAVLGFYERLGFRQLPVACLQKVIEPRVPAGGES